VKLLPVLITGIQHTAVCQKNGIESEEPTTNFHIVYVCAPSPPTPQHWRIFRGLLYATAWQNRIWAYLMRRQCYKTFAWEIGVKRGCHGAMKLWSLQLQSRCDTPHYNLWLNLSSQTVIKP